MKISLKYRLAFALAVTLTTVQQRPLLAQPTKRAVVSQSLIPPAYPQSRVDANMIEFPLPKGEQAYAPINGHKIHQYVVEQAEISRRFRDSGHPKWWGRITGFSSDTEDQQWMMEKFKQFGMTDIHLQPFNLIPQWDPVDWTTTITGGGQTINLSSSQPAYNANPFAEADLDAVYAGLGTEADFAGKDVKGKAVFVYSMQGLPDLGAVRRAADKG